MRIPYRNFSRSLAQIAGIVLIASCAPGIADSIAYSSDDRSADPAPNGPSSVAAKRDGADNAPQAAAAARATRIGRDPDTDSSAPATGASRRTDDAEIALLLDWHHDANSVTGASHPEEMPHSN